MRFFTVTPTQYKIIEFWVEYPNMKYRDMSRKLGVPEASMKMMISRSYKKCKIQNLSGNLAKKKKLHEIFKCGFIRKGTHSGKDRTRPGSFYIAKIANGICKIGYTRQNVQHYVLTKQNWNPAIELVWSITLHDVMLFECNLKKLLHARELGVSNSPETETFYLNSHMIQIIIRYSKLEALKR